MDETLLYKLCRSLYDEIERLDAIAMSVLGVSRTELHCLNLVVQSPKTAGEIGEAIRLTSGSTTTLLSRLENAGYITRKKHQSDRRKVYVHPTKKLFSEVGELYRSVAVEINQLPERYSQSENRIIEDCFRDVLAAYQKTVRNKISEHDL